MRHLLRLLIIAVPAVLTLGVSPASAGLSTWTGLLGLNAASGAELGPRLRDRAAADDDLRGDRGRRRLALAHRRRDVERLQRRAEHQRGRDARALGLHERDDRLREHHRGPVQVGRRRRLPAGGAGPGGRSEEPEEAQRPGAGRLQHHRRPDARGRRERRRLSLQRRRRDLDQARARQRHGALRRRSGASASSSPAWCSPRPGSGIYRSLNAGATWTLSSDGISGTTLRVFADEKAPNIYYAAGHGGVFRTINAGVTWSSIDGPPATRSPPARSARCSR